MPSDRFELDALQLGRVKFALSPGFEALRAVRYLLHPARAAGLHRSMLSRLRERAPRKALEVLRHAIPARGYTPDFLAPPDISTPAEWLGAVASTAPDRVASELRQLAAESGAELPEAWVRQPGRASRELAEALTEFWDHAMSTEWRAIEITLRSDIAARSRQWTGDGIGSVLNSLHPRVSWDGRAIVRSDSPWGVRATGARGLLLIPSVLVWPNLAIAEDPHYPACLVYPALNASALPVPAGRGGLESLLGRTRARILRQVRIPSRGIDLATALDLSQATVSHHVAILGGTGLIITSRSGTEAWHAQSELGATLVASADQAERA